MNRSLLISGLLFLAACQSGPEKICPPVQARALLTETEALKNRLAASGEAFQEDSMGYFYKIENSGTGKQPHACSDVTVDYEGTLLNGTQFDAGKNVSFNLSQLIQGWQMGIPKIKEGGSIVLMLPPSLAYGDQAQEKIPAGSDLRFRITLKSVR